MVASGNASEKDWLQSSTAASRDDLVVVFHWMPPWHWSMTNAIAKKDFTSFGHRHCGWMIVSKKCLITGKMAKHSDAVQLNFWAFLFFQFSSFGKVYGYIGICGSLGIAKAGNTFPKIGGLQNLFVQWLAGSGGSPLEQCPARCHASNHGKIGRLVAQCFWTIGLGPTSMHIWNS